MNLAQFLNRFYQDLGEPNKNKFPQDLVIEWLDEVQNDLNLATKSIKGNSILDAVVDQRLYTWPTDAIQWDLRKVYLATGTNVNEREELPPVGIDVLDENDSDWRTDTGTPCYFYVEQDEGKYGLYPTPNSLSIYTNAIRLVYPKTHTKMVNYYETGTVSVTNASAIVTGSGTTFTGNVSVGDKFGVGALLNRSTAFPKIWFEVQSVDSDTQLTLTANYSGATDSGQSFITAQESSITDKELNLACLDLMKAKAKEKDKQFDLVTYFEAKARSRAEDRGYELDYLPDARDMNAPMKRNKSGDYGHS